MAGKTKEEVTVVASLTVSSAQGDETVKSFDRAWHIALTHPKPVLIRFNGFVRKD